MHALIRVWVRTNWVIGTSIGAANAAIIAGNEPAERPKKLREFWEIVTSPLSGFFIDTQNVYVRKWQNFLSAQWTLLFGQPGFFEPACCFFSDEKSTPDKIGFYDTTLIHPLIS